jgi:hypothetical protein
MMRNELFLEQKMQSITGPIRAPGYEARRVSFEEAVRTVNNRVVHNGCPTGHEHEHGSPDLYPGLLPFASNAHIVAVANEMKRLEKESMPALKTIARQRGYYRQSPSR